MFKKSLEQSPEQSQNKVKKDDVFNAAQQPDVNLKLLAITQQYADGVVFRFVLVVEHQLQRASRLEAPRRGRSLFGGPPRQKMA